MNVTPDSTVVIEFIGRIPSKKNLYMPNRRGKGMFKCAALLRRLNDLRDQIPRPYWGLKLINPDITVQVTTPSWRISDRDNILTTILDLLVEAQVLADDCVTKCNGRIVIEPVTCVRGGNYVTVVTLTPSAAAPALPSGSAGLAECDRDGLAA